VWTNRHVPNTIIYYPTLQAEAAGSTGTLVVTSANGKVDLKGFEFETEFKATAALTLEATFDVAATVIKNTSCSDCLTLTGNADPVGNQLPYYPKLTGSLSATYERSIGAFDGFVRGDAVYTGKMYDSESNLTYTADAATVNLHIGVKRDGYRAELYGINIFDNTTPTSLARTSYSIYAPSGTSKSVSGITVSPPQPLTIGLRLSKQF
jgi:iron complex outermembrane receptor protein